jgi:hypothetical protein
VWYRAGISKAEEEKDALVFHGVEVDKMEQEQCCQLIEYSAAKHQNWPNKY